MPANNSQATPIVFEGKLADKDALELPEQYIQEIKRQANSERDDAKRAPHACLHLGIWYACGVNHPHTGDVLIAKNLNEAVANVRKAGDIGSPDIALQVGECFDPENSERLFTGSSAAKVAIYYYKLALNRGLDKAYYKLAYCYRDGHGVRQDMDAATNLIVLAAYRGYREAQLDVADLLEEAGYDHDAEAWRMIAGDPREEDLDNEDGVPVLIQEDEEGLNIYEIDTVSLEKEYGIDEEELEKYDGYEDEYEDETVETLEPQSIYVEDFFENGSTRTEAVLKSRMRFYEQLRANDDIACKEAAHAMGELFVREVMVFLREAEEAAKEEQAWQQEHQHEVKFETSEDEVDEAPSKHVFGKKLSEMIDEDIHPFFILIGVFGFILLMLYIFQELLS